MNMLAATADTYRVRGRARVSEADLAIIARPPFPNALLIGSPGGLRPIVEGLLPFLRGPITYCNACAGPAIRGDCFGTRLISNVERLGLAEQSQLYELTNRAERAVQIIAISTTNLFDCMRRQEFLESLYYRLNTIHVSVM